MSINVALLGAGIFAIEEHLPAIQILPQLALKAVYSRSQQSAEKLAAAFGAPVDIYSDTSSQSLDHLLGRPDIHAVVIALPITVQPDLIRKALKAGKHVLSEKPIGKDVATAQELVKFYHSLERRPIWAVGENFRFWNSINAAAATLREWNANVVTFRTSVYSLINDDNKFFQTEWRKAPEYQGGFLLDGGVHFVAMTRYLLEALGEKVNKVVGFSTSLLPKLGPVDTLDAIWQLTNGRNGSFNCSFGTEYKSAFEVEVVTDQGSILVKPTEITVITKDASGEKSSSSSELEMTNGVKEEMAMFTQGLLNGVLDQRLSVEEAFEDVKVLENMLSSNGLAKDL
ncbi:hypothetical protein BBP40_004595 [Aspergillus hancockii]|nr:hypothetical protein BBP40_004595 [Aspergillus hancockii]